MILQVVEEEPPEEEDVPPMAKPPCTTIKGDEMERDSDGGTVELGVALCCIRPSANMDGAAPEEQVVTETDRLLSTHLADQQTFGY